MSKDVTKINRAHYDNLMAQLQETLQKKRIAKEITKMEADKMLVDFNAQFTIVDNKDLPNDAEKRDD